MNLSDLIRDLPAARSIAGVRESIRRQLAESGQRLVVLDDDPTGTQTVCGVRVYMDWSVGQLRKALTSEESVFYISTNSRSLNREEAKELNYQLGRNLSEAARREGTEVIIASRSDSTLRGHFPHEVEALVSGMGYNVEGVIIVPAFFEGGRYTINDVHWVDQGGRVVPAEETEFARDPAFGYRHSNLKLWTEERTEGRIKVEDVRSISLEIIRAGGPEAVAEELLSASGGKTIIVNAACYRDLEVFVLGLLSAESRGKKFVYRCAASFVKVRGGFPDRPLLGYEELKPGEGPGLVVVGSYVEKTSRQLDCLLRTGLITGRELPVDKLMEADERQGEIQRVSGQTNELLRRGQSVAIYTSRDRKSAREERFLEMGRVIMSSLCQVVRQVGAPPGFLVAKGGITSMEIARSALEVKEAQVLGQIEEGVPVWRLGSESRWPEIPYVVFPGNVGDDRMLCRILKTLQGRGGINDE